MNHRIGRRRAELRVPEAYRYRSDAELLETLQRLVGGGEPLRTDRSDLLAPLDRSVVLPRYRDLFCRLIEGEQSL